MGFEDIDIGEESIDDMVSELPDGWKKTELYMTNYSKEYAHDIYAEITVVFTNADGPYVVSHMVKDKETGKKLSEKSYLAEDKDIMEGFVAKLIELYDKVFPENKE